MTASVTLPFHGFYESIHDDALSRNFDIELAENPNFGFDNWNKVDVLQARTNYCKDYVTYVLSELGIVGGFQELISPRFYNFETDRIFIYVLQSEAERLVRNALNNRVKLGNIIIKLFTAKEGLVPNYGNKLEHWLNLFQRSLTLANQLDHNQMYVALLAAHPDVDWDELQQDFVEEWSGNNGGYLDYIREDNHETSK